MPMKKPNNAVASPSMCACPWVELNLTSAHVQFNLTRVCSTYRI